MKIRGNIIDLHQRRIFFGELTIENGCIARIDALDGESADYILPGFTDAHVHIESSMLVPSEFAPMAVVHGTVATVSDPHEIANVLGIEGVRYMIENGKTVPFKFNFGAPSCVPATSFETAGAEIGVKGVRKLLEMPEIKYLAEMMNYPGVIFDDPMVHAKIRAAHDLGKPIDGHAPGVRGKQAKKYISAGISTDHECFTYEEALEKLQLGMKILIREGSAAKNFDALIDLLPQFPDRMMFCSDDKHPDDLLEGHINQLVARAVARGFDLFDVLNVACQNPVRHYGLEVGLLREGDPADFIITDDLTRFNIKATYIDGQLVAENGRTHISAPLAPVVNNFTASPKKSADFAVPAKGKRIKVMEALDGELITKSSICDAKIKDGLVCADPEKDVLKI
ncbi:MAG: adenine deaminase, partial [Bacteroidetes bacterium]